jgi:hypothetical protein
MVVPDKVVDALQAALNRRDRPLALLALRRIGFWTFCWLKTPLAGSETHIFWDRTMRWQPVLRCMAAGQAWIRTGPRADVQRRDGRTC